MKAISPLSAQCRSSNTRATVLRSARCSKNRLQALKRSSRSARRPLDEPEELLEPGLDPLPLRGVGDVLRERLAQLAERRGLVLRLDDPRAAAKHLRERPVRDSVAVGEASAAVPVDGVDHAVRVLLELPGEARLPDAGDPDHRQQVCATLGRRRVEEVLDEPELALATDERRLEARRSALASARGHDPRRPVERDGLGLPLQLVAPGLLVRDRRLGRAPGRVADEDGSGIGRRLDARGGVHEVPGDHALALGADRDCCLSGEDAGARLERRVELGDGGHEVECRADRALRVVLLCDRRSPDRHDGVADELLDRASVALDDRAGGLEVPGEELTRVLGVALLGGGREADEVGEEDGDETTFGRGTGR